MAWDGTSLATHLHSNQQPFSHILTIFEAGLMRVRWIHPNAFAGANSCSRWRTDSSNKSSNASDTLAELHFSTRFRSTGAECVRRRGVEWIRPWTSHSPYNLTLWLSCDWRSSWNLKSIEIVSRCFCRRDGNSVQTPLFNLSALSFFLAANLFDWPCWW